MTTESLCTPVPYEAQEALRALQAEFPGVHLRLQHTRGWQLRASGPCGSVTMRLSEPVRSASLRAACRMVSENNLGGDAA